MKRIKKSVYVVPEDILEIYQRYKEGSGEAETEVRELAKTMRRRSAFRYQLEVEEALEADCAPKDVSVPECIPEPKAASILEKAEKKFQRHRKRNERFKRMAAKQRSGRA